VIFLSVRRITIILSEHVVKKLFRAVNRSVMIIIVLPVGWFRFLGEKESGPWFRMNKIWRFV